MGIGNGFRRVVGRLNTRFRGMGYRMVDNRASGGAREEDDLLGCGHCQALIRKSEWQQDGGYCHHCDKPLCGAGRNNCAAKPGCTPFEETLQRALDNDYRRRQNARILGI